MDINHLLLYKSSLVLVFTLIDSLCTKCDKKLTLQNVLNTLSFYLLITNSFSYVNVPTYLSINITIFFKCENNTNQSVNIYKKTQNYDCLHEFKGRQMYVANKSVVKITCIFPNFPALETKESLKELCEIHTYIVLISFLS